MEPHRGRFSHPNFMSTSEAIANALLALMGDTVNPLGCLLHLRTPMWPTLERLPLTHQQGGFLDPAPPVKKDSTATTPCEN